MKADLAKLNLDVDAIGKILQNVVYIPSSMDGNRRVHFLFYAKQNKEADYEIVSKRARILKLDSVSPASAIKTNTDLEDYVIGFDGQLYTLSQYSNLHLRKYAGSWCDRGNNESR